VVEELASTSLGQGQELMERKKIEMIKKVLYYWEKFIGFFKFSRKKINFRFISREVKMANFEACFVLFSCHGINDTRRHNTKNN